MAKKNTENFFRAVSHLLFPIYRVEEGVKKWPPLSPDPLRPLFRQDKMRSKKYQKQVNKHSKKYIYIQISKNPKNSVSSFGPWPKTNKPQREQSPRQQKKKEEEKEALITTHLNDRPRSTLSVVGQQRRHVRRPAHIRVRQERLRRKQKNGHALC